jgi:hypothetical protein
MRQSLKVAVSLLIATVLFAGFAVLAFSGLFDVLQASFFYPQLREEYQRQLEGISTRIEEYHSRNIERFTAAASKPYMASAFEIQPRQPEADVRQLVETVSALGVAGMRLLDLDGRKIHYSSFATDRQSTTARGVAFANLDEADP